MYFDLQQYKQDMNYIELEFGKGLNEIKKLLKNNNIYLYEND